MAISRRGWSKKPQTATSKIGGGFRKPDNLLLFNGNIKDSYSSNLHSFIGSPTFAARKGMTGLDSGNLQDSGVSLNNFATGDRTFILTFERKVSATATENDNKVQQLVAGGSANILSVNAGNGFGAGGDIDKPRVEAGNSSNLAAFIDGVKYTSLNPIEKELNNRQIYTLVITGNDFDASTLHDLASFDGYSLSGSIYFYTTLPYKVSDTEALELSKNPYKVLQPRQNMMIAAVGGSTAIAAWSTPTNSRISTTEIVGVVAFHVNGIDKVTLSLNGAGGIDVSAPTRVNGTDAAGAATVHYEYQIEIDASLYSDGLVTVDATIVPVSGVSKVLAQIDMYANSGGTVGGTTTWYIAGTTGSDATGDGSNISTPYKTFAALWVVGMDPGDTIIILEAGQYFTGRATNPNNLRSVDYWSVVKPATGLAAWSVELLGEASIPATVKPDFDKLVYTNLLFNLTNTTSVNSEVAGCIHWFDGCKIISDDNAIDTGSTDGNSSSLRAYYTNTIFDTVTSGPEGSTLAKGCVLSGITGDAFSGCQLVLNCEVTDFDGTISAIHSDLYQLQAFDNRLLYNVGGDTVSVEHIFCNLGASSGSNLACVNVGASTSAPGSTQSQFIGNFTHVLIWNCTSMQSLLWGTDTTFSAVDFDIRNTVVGKFNNLATPGTIPDGVTIANCHSVDVTYNLGTNSSNGDVDYSWDGSDWLYSGTDIADITDTGIIIDDVTQPDWTYGSPSTPNKGAWPQSAWTAAPSGGGGTNRGFLVGFGRMGLR